MSVSLLTKAKRLKEVRRKHENLRRENMRLKAYIEALEVLAVRSVSLTRAQLRSAIRRRQNLDLTKKKP